jgi:uncharacterized protein YcbX
MTAIGRLQAIWRYPVSSLSGESLSDAAIDPDGVRGDRLAGIVDAASGEIAAPEKKRRWRTAPEIQARLADGGIELRLPGGAWLAAEGAATSAALAGHLGFAAEIRRHPGQGSNGAPTVEPRYKRNHIHLLSTASLATLQALLPDSRVHPRRFRPNLVVELPLDPAGPFPETAWGIGREFTIGTVRLAVAEPCQRCAFTVLAQGDQPQDPAVLAAITQHNGTHFGVLCSVLAPGNVSLGDPLTLL